MDDHRDEIRAHLDACWAALERNQPLPPVPAALREQLSQERLRDLEDGRSNIDSQRRRVRAMVSPVRGYQLVASVGHGAQAEVFRAIREHDGGTVAIKLFRDARTAGGMVAERAERETAALRGIVAPEVVKLLDRGTTIDGRPFLVLEWLAGDSLEKRLPEGRRVPDDTAIRILLDIAAGMSAAHAAGVVHRDLKPGNVMFRGFESAASRPDDPLAGAGAAAVIDFGVQWRRDRDDALTGPDGIAGTLPHLAPEQIDEARRDEIGPATDVFALGGIGYRMVFGAAPFAGTDYLVTDQIRRAEPPGFLSARSEVGADLLAILVRCLEKAPQRRYADAGALAEDLRRLQAGRRPHAPRLTVRRIAQRFVRRHALPAAWLAVVIIALAAAAVVSSRAAWRATHAVRLAADTLTTITDDILSDPRLSNGGMTTLHTALLERTTARLDEFSRAEPSELASRLRGHAALSLAYSLDIRGQSDAAWDAAVRAEVLLREAAADLDDGVARRLLGRSLALRGAMQARYSDDLERAESDTREALAILESLWELGGRTDVEVAHRAALARNNLGNVLAAGRRSAEAVVEYHRALDLFRAAARTEPLSRIWLAKATSNLGLVLADSDPGEAERLLRNAVETVQPQIALLDELDTASTVVGNHDADYAFAYREALAIATTNLGEFLVARDRAAEAHEPLWTALGEYSRLALGDPASFEFAWGVAMARTNVAAVAAAGHPGIEAAEAQAWLDAAWSWYAKAIHRRRDNAELPDYVVRHWQVHAGLLRRVGPDLGAVIDRIATTLAALPDDDPRQGEFAGALVDTLAESDRPRPERAGLRALAHRLAANAPRLAAAAPESDPLVGAELATAAANLLRATGDAAAAQSTADAAERLIDAVGDAAEPADLATARAALAACRAALRPLQPSAVAPR